MKVIGCFLGLAVAIASLLGCRANYHFETADEVMQKTQITYDQYLDDTTVNGPFAETSDKKARYMLTAQYSERKLQYYELVILQLRTREVGAAHYYEAFDPAGKRFEVSKYDTFSGWDEKVGIKIPRDYLLNSEETGMEFKYFGRRDSLVVRVDGFYIQGFLAKIKKGS